MARTQVDPKRMYVAVGTVALPNGVTVQAGERRHGGDPIVTGWPDWWRDETTTTPEQIRAEEAQKFEQVLRADPDRAARPAPVQREVMVCVKRGLRHPSTGLDVRLGEEFLDVHPVVTENPNYFKPRDEIFPEAAA